MEVCTLILTAVMLSPMTLEVEEHKIPFCGREDLWNELVEICEKAEGKGYIPDKAFIPSDGSPPLLSCVKGEA